MIRRCLMQNKLSQNHKYCKICANRKKKLAWHSSLNSQQRQVIWMDMIDAARMGSTGALLRQIRLGKDVNQRDSNGHTALHWACFQGHFDCVEILLDNSADREAMSGLNESPLIWACKSESLACAELLLVRGANPNIVDRRGRTPLHSSVSNRLREMTRILLEYGASTYARDQRGNTPFHDACYFGWADMVLLLMRFGGRPHHPNIDGITPFQLAVWNNHLDCVAIINYETAWEDGDAEPLDEKSYTGLARARMVRQMISSARGGPSVREAGSRERLSFCAVDARPVLVD